jgi:hypothetical protein
MTSPASVIARVVLLLVVAGCGDFAHTSPYDEETPVTVEIVGPDVVHLGVDAQPIQYSVRTSPQSQLVAKWSCAGGVSGCDFASQGRASLTFTSNGQITVRVGLYSATKSVTVQ